MILKIGLASVFLLQAIVLTGGGWCGFHRWCYPEFFLTRVDASVCVLFGAVFLFFATKQAFRGLHDQNPSAYEGETTAPRDVDPVEKLRFWWPREDLETVADPDWWIQPGPDA